ncbi:MAG: ATP-binding protein [Chloroflexota bacterium]|nr:ATP-binding protein [Chloroflexota bacterium]
MTSIDRTQVDFGLLLEAMPDAVIVADMDSRIRYANAAVERLLGWRADELVGQPLHVIQPERLRVPHDASFGRYVATGNSRLMGSPIRVPALSRDGSECDIELNLAEIRDPTGHRLVVGVLRDLSERVELERSVSVLRYLKATTAAAARLWTRLDPTLVLQTLTDVLVEDFDAALVRTWISEPETGMLRMVTSGGLSKRVADSPRHHIDPATHPYKMGMVARTKQPFLKNDLGGDPQFDQAWVAREGIQAALCLPLLAGDELLGILVFFSRNPVFDEVAEIIGHLAALAAAALKDSELVAQERDARSGADRARARFELLAGVSEQLASSLNPEETVERIAEAVVPAFADWCVVDLVSSGETLETVASAHRDADMATLIGQLRLRYPPLARASPPHAIYRALDAGAPVWETVSDTDLEARAVDVGHLGLLRELGIGSHIVVPLAARGRAVGAISFVRGPEREPYDADAVVTAMDLARRSGLAIDNAELYRSAQQAIQLRDRFLAVASHELRTPLSVVRGHWELLQRRIGSPANAGTPDGDRTVTSLRRLGQGIDQLQRLVEDLLDVNRLGTGETHLERSPVDLVGLVRDAVDDLGPSRKGRVRLDLPTSAVVGAWDAARLTQVLGNVIGNALKYSPANGTVDVSLTAEPHTARFRVSDAGIGIAPDQLEAIFEPFSRAPNASAQHYPGIGLGLAISREIVDRLGGRIWAESVGEGRGTAFIVELPRSAPADPAVTGSAERGDEE